MASAHHLSYTPFVPTPLYTRDILRLATSIPHLGRLEAPDGSAERRSAVCGSRVIVDVRMDEAGQVTELGQEVQACALGQASAALMGRSAVGRTPAELAAARDGLAVWLRGDSDSPGDWPGLDALAVARAYPARHAAILIPFEAVADAATNVLQDWAAA